MSQLLSGLTGTLRASSLSTGPTVHSVTPDAQGSTATVPSRNRPRFCAGDLNQALGRNFDSGHLFSQTYRANPVGSTSSEILEELEEWQLVPDEVILYFTGETAEDKERDDAHFFRNVANQLRICYLKLAEIRTSKHRENLRQSSAELVSAPSSSVSLSFSSDIQESSVGAICYDSSSWLENSRTKTFSKEDDLKATSATNSFSTVTSTEESLSSVELIFPQPVEDCKDNQHSCSNEQAHDTLCAEDLLLPYVDDNKENMLFSLLQDFPFDYSDSSSVEVHGTFSTSNDNRKVIDQQPQNLTFWSELCYPEKNSSSDRSSDSSVTVSDVSPPDFSCLENAEKYDFVDCKESSIQKSVSEFSICPDTNVGKVNGIRLASLQDNRTVQDIAGSCAEDKRCQKLITELPDGAHVEWIRPRLKKFWSAEEDKKDISETKVPSVPGNDLVFHVNQLGAVKVGEGSFGSVYLADLFTKRAVYQVVVKDFSPKGMTKPLEILEEARILMHLLDTGFVPYFYGVTHVASPQRFALVQEFFGQGMSLHNLLEDKPLQLSRTSWMNLCIQMAVGIDLFHRKGILMNDIKKDNILVDCRDEDDCQLKFIDMGLASYKTGRVFYGSCDYMQQFTHLAPEVRHLMQTSPASDVYSLGKILCSIAKNVPLDPVKHIALPCLHQYPEYRPTVQELVSQLIEAADSLDKHSPLEFKNDGIAKQIQNCF